MAARIGTGVYKPEDIHLFRLRKMTSVVSRNVLHVVYKETMRDRRSKECVFEFYQRKSVPVDKFEKNLNRKQIQKILDDPEGKKFDVTLLYQCLIWGERGLAQRNDDKWKVGNPSLESLITKIKDKRNILFHEEFLLDEKEFYDETENLRDLLTRTLKETETRFRISKAEIDQLITDMNRNINLFRDESWIHFDLDNYKKHNLFKEKRRYIKIKGILWLSSLYNRWVYITPASLICELDFKVNEIFTEMVFKSQDQFSKEIPVQYEDLLDSISRSRGDPVLLIEGLAGVGKTTLTKKLMTDWVSGKSSMTNLTSYSLLLYSEFRNRKLSSFKDLVESLMPDLPKVFQDSDYMTVLLDLNTIVIMDGIDEFNDASMKLFQEVLELKKSHGITVLVTTRPERVETYYHLTNARGIKTRHIKLTGIPEEKRKDYVLKYFSAIKKAGKTKQDVNELLAYLDRTAHRLSNLLGLPFNLTLLTILWVYRAAIINMITTEPELYWEIHRLVVDKLIRRLVNNATVPELPKSSLNKRVDNFTYALCYEAIAGLAKDDINLSEESFKRLEDVCNHEQLPTKEMTGSFLKRVIMITPAGMDTKYSFPHKGLQDFLGALYILREAGGDVSISVTEDILQEFEKVLKMHKTGDEIAQDILRYSRERMTAGPQETTSFISRMIMKSSTKITSILKNMDGTPAFDIRKYQNLLLSLLGLFHLKNIKVKNTMKREVLQLLKESGIKTGEDWLRILKSVRCDEFVARFITEQHRIFEKDIKIKDNNLLAYLTLFRASSDPITVKVDIIIKEETFGINELLEEINKKKLEVRNFEFPPDFQEPSSPVISKNVLTQIVNRCTLETYRGTFHRGMMMGNGIQRLYVSVDNPQDYDALLSLLKSHRLVRFELCLSPRLPAMNLNPLPDGLKSCLISLVSGPVRGLVCYMPDVCMNNIEEAAGILGRIQPKEGFRCLCFPRSIIKTRDEFLYLINTLEKHHISGIRDPFGNSNILFPSSIKPSSDEERRRIGEEAKTKLGFFVNWGGRGDISIDDW